MSDQRISQLTEVTAPADGDSVPILDVSDTDQSAAGSTRRAQVSHLIGGPGNVLKFGADPTGVADSSTAFQSALDSDYAVFVPYGSYYIPTELTVSAPKVIIFEDGLLPPVNNLTLSIPAGDR